MKREETYRFYYADALQIIADNTSHVEGGRYLTKSLRELIYPPPPEPTETRSCLEIVQDMFSRHKSSKKGG